MNKYVELYNNSNYSQMNSRPDCLPDLIKWLTEMLEKAPSEYHKDVIIEFSSNENTFDIDEIIYYNRPATQEEIDAILEDARIRKEKREAEERKQYEQLKAKFDP